jgi:16S rRNA (cytosine967-C5)-methyltransferase
MSKNAGTSSPPKRKSSSVRPGAREVAATVLTRVWNDAAWAAPTLDAELGRAAGLDPRDARLATELVYGVLRTQRRLEREIARFTPDQRWRKQELMHVRMLIAAYELLLLDRIPGFAAVSEAVTAVKAKKGSRVAGFVNAVLRKLAAEDQRLVMAEAVAEGAPRWLTAALTDVLGEEGARAYLAADVPPPLCLCLRAGEDRDAWLEQLSAVARVEPGRLSPSCVLVHGGDHRKLPGYRSAWSVQEEGAQLLALSLGASQGDVVLDACAGRGGKAALLIDRGATVDAADLHPRKLEILRAAMPKVRACYAVDWTRGSGDVPEGYDRVMIDAPCSGSGTLRRRPEIAARLQGADVTRLAAVQLELARRAASRARVGGTVLYAVCSVLREECEGVTDALLAGDARDGGVRLVPEELPLPLSGGQARLLPHVHGTDGYFVARFRREA